MSMIQKDCRFTAFHQSAGLISLGALIFSLVVYAERTRADEATVSVTPHRNAFALKRGQGTPVCDSYLKLLNATTFDRMPFCGRPADGPVEGFMHLERRDLNSDEAYRLFGAIYKFMRVGDQSFAERVFDPQPVFLDVHSIIDKPAMQAFMQRRRIHVWNYTVPVDVENSNSPLNILVWQGYGVSDNGVPCGADMGHAWNAPYSNQAAFVLTADGESIDMKKTVEVFGRVVAGREPSVGKQSPNDDPNTGLQFHPMADSMDVFEFEGRYYIQVEDKPSGPGAPLPPVKVLLREGGHIHEICSLEPKDVPGPN